MSGLSGLPMHQIQNCLCKICCEVVNCLCFHRIAYENIGNIGNSLVFQIAYENIGNIGIFKQFRQLPKLPRQLIAPGGKQFVDDVGF